MWIESHRADVKALPLADRHYNRQKIGSPQFVPPGRCFVLRSDCGRALWVSSWPFGEFVRHSWPGAWINSLFRSEGAGVASALIIEAVSLTRGVWQTPAQGMMTFVDPAHVPGVKRRLPSKGARRHVFESEGRTEVYGYSYLRAGFGHVGYTKGGLWAWMLLPLNMPPAKRFLTELELAVINPKFDRGEPLPPKRVSAHA